MMGTVDEKASPNPSIVHRKGGAIKAVEAKQDGWLEGYLVAWGSPNDTDLQGEHFTPDTEFCLDWFKERPVLYHHGLDGDTGLRKIGTIKVIEADKLGLWVQAQLDLRDRYASAVYDMVKSHDFGWSSGSVDHLVKISPDGQIVTWPIIEGSITPTPAQPAKTSVRALKSVSDSEKAVSYRAFKAALSSDSDYLRGLDSRVRTSPDRILSERKTDTALAQSLAKKFADEYGIRASSSEVAEVAQRMSGVIDEIVVKAAAKELDEAIEMQKTLAALEREMVKETDMPIRRVGRRSEEQVEPVAYRSRNRARRTTEMLDETRNLSEEGSQALRRLRARRSARRQDDMTFASRLEAQEQDLGVRYADEIAARAEEAVQNQIRTQVDAENQVQEVAQKIMRRAKRLAMRQLDSFDDTGATLSNGTGISAGGTGSSNPDYLATRRFGRRARRNVGGFVEPTVRQDIVEPLRYTAEDVLSARYEDIVGRSDEMPLPVRRFRTDLNEVPVRRFRSEDEMATPVRRFRRGARSAFRQEMEQLREELEGMRSSDTLEEIRAEEEAALVKTVAKRAYSNGFKRGASAGMKLSEQVGNAGVPTITEDNSVTGNAAELAYGGGDITATRRFRGRRNVGEMLTSRTDDMIPVRRNSMRRFRSELEEVPVRRFRTEDEMATPVRRFRAEEELPMRRYRTEEELPMRRFRADEEFATPVRRFRSEEELPVRRYRAEEELPMRRFRTEDEMATPVRRFRTEDEVMPQRSWKSYAKSLERMEAPRQRNFGRITGVTDVADRGDNYVNAFKAYLLKGESRLDQQQKYILDGKGQTRWNGEAGGGSFIKSANGSYKTYFSGSDAGIGYAVPPEWVNELNKNIQSQTVMANECRTRNTTSDVLVQPNVNTTDARRSYSATLSWPDEQISSGAKHRSAEDNFTQLRLPINIMMLSITASNSSLEDVTFDLEQFINDAFSERVAVMYDELIWSGDGQAKLEGIVTNNKVSGAPSLTRASVGGYIASGSVNGIPTADVIKKMLFHLPRGYRQKAKWYMNSDTGLALSTLKDANGNYLIDQRNDSLQSVGVPDKLMGLPILYNEFADEVSEGEFPIVLADLSRGYLIGKRVDFSIRRFDDSQYAELDQVLFLGRARVGGQVWQPAAIKVLKIAES